MIHITGLIMSSIALTLWVIHAYNYFEQDIAVLVYSIGVYLGFYLIHYGISKIKIYLPSRKRL